VVFVVFFVVLTIFETWSEENKAFFAGRKLTLNGFEVKRIGQIRHHPEHRNLILQYLRIRESTIKRENKWLSSIGEL